MRAALIGALAEWKDDETKKGFFTIKSLRKISRQIGIRSAWQELGVFSVTDLKHIMHNEFLLI